MSIALKAKTKQRPQGNSLANAARRCRKLGLWGHSGGGKTYALLGALLGGEKICMASTDFGGDGLDTVEGALHALGREDLLENVLNVNLLDYDDIYAFCLDPREFFSEDLADVTVYAIDGYSTAQIHGVDEKILSVDQNIKSEAREAGISMVQKDWDGVKRLTIRPLIKFFNLGIDEEKKVYPSKVITFLENQREDALTNNITRGPMIQGAARGLVIAGFDIFAQAYQETDKKTQTRKYYYRLRGSDKYAVKLRSRDQLPDIVEADPEALWRALKDPNAAWGKVSS